MVDIRQDYMVLNYCPRVTADHEGSSTNSRSYDAFADIKMDMDNADIYKDMFVRPLPEET